MAVRQFSNLSQKTSTDDSEVRKGVIHSAMPLAIVSPFCSCHILTFSVMNMGRTTWNLLVEFSSNWKGE